MESHYDGPDFENIAGLSKSLYQNGVGVAWYGDDDKAGVKFWWDVRRNNAKFERGEIAYDRVCMMEIQHPGKNSTFATEIKLDKDGNPDPRNDYVKRFPKAWEAFKRQEKPVAGTPVAKLPFLKPEQVALLMHIGCTTLEQLCEMPDVQVQQIGLGGRQIRADAQAFQKMAKDSAETIKLSRENENLRLDLLRLETEVKRLCGLLDPKTAATVCSPALPSSQVQAAPIQNIPQAPAFDMAQLAGLIKDQVREAISQIASEEVEAEEPKPRGRPKKLKEAV